MDFSRFNFVARALSWKNNMASAVARLEEENQLLRAALDEAKVSTGGAIRSHAAAIAESENELRQARRAQEELSRAVGGLEQRHGNLNHQQEQLEERQSALREVVSGLEDQRVSLDAAVGALTKSQTDVQQRQAELESRHAALQNEQQMIAREAASLFQLAASRCGLAGSLVAEARSLYLVQRGADVVLVCSDRDNPPFRSSDIEETLASLNGERPGRLYVTVDPAPRSEPVLEAADEVRELILTMPKMAELVLQAARQAPLDISRAEFYREALSLARANPQVVPALAEYYTQAFGEPPRAFSNPETLPRTAPAEPKRRSALFLHNNYYHFNCLAEALKKRGWDAMTVSVASPDNPDQQFFFGEDLNLWDDDPTLRDDKIRRFLASAPERFGAMHFYGLGSSSFFPDEFENSPSPEKLPWDMLELRRHRMLIGYMAAGCLDVARQSDIRRISGGVCASCVWENEPKVCSDTRNAAWIDRIESLCDWIALDGDWVVANRTGTKYVRGAVITALDANAWKPDLVPKPDMVVPKAKDEILIYHAVGNTESRKKGRRDIKGTQAVFDAVAHLKREGLPVRLMFFSKVPSRDIKNYQVQADIVVDQLRYGRYGANAREAMMLGRPVVGYLDGRVEGSGEPLRQIAECPIVRADPGTIKDVLRDLVLDADKRSEAGRASREFAVRWHAAEACAERYEKIIDRLRSGLDPDSPDLYPVRA